MATLITIAKDWKQTTQPSNGKDINCVVVVQSLSHVWLCIPMNCSTQGFPVLHYLLELAPTHFHWVCDAIQPSHPLLPPSLALNLSQHQGLFQRVGSSHQVAKIASAADLPVNIQSLFPSGLTALISLQSKGLSRGFSSNTIQKHWFFSTQASLLSSSHIHTWLLEKP